MSYERNTETQEALKREIKVLQGNCVNMCNVIDNAPPDLPPTTLDEVSEKINYYIEGLRTDVKNSNTTITMDDNLITNQFLKEIKEKTEQLDELLAFKKGCIHDLDAENNRLKNLLKIAKEAQSKPKINKCEVKPEHIERAKEKFQAMKMELKGLIQSLFPHCHETIMDLMGQLMASKLEENPDGYIPITTENYNLIKLLQDLNIVNTNPYNDMEVKLTFY